MTIFYLPLSFVAVCIPSSILIPSSLVHGSTDFRWKQALFGMHLFDGADPKQTQRSFYMSAVLIAILTYLLSGLAVWWVGDLEREQELKERWQAWKTKRSNKKANAKDPAKTKNEEKKRAQPSEKLSEHIWLHNLLHRRRKKGAEPAPPSP